ncbi:YciI family protein [Agrococcus sp. Marseille-P2731]|uniref:YciI family protein n=1 Tax=Agrococcus sp. Marseille-P2731 TaxID=1841862 RepID=UPI000931E596|nr:YciI family protein [Agrococcus sp. Marseille-P2731]
MTKFLITFPPSAMQVTPEELPAVSEASHAVIRELKAAGVYVFGGGIDEAVAPVRVAGDGTVTDGGHAETSSLAGGFLVIEAATREDALTWAAKVAEGCRCPQQVQEFMYDAES